jgi:hypothetical protein
VRSLGLIAPTLKWKIAVYGRHFLDAGVPFSEIPPFVLTPSQCRQLLSDDGQDLHALVVHEQGRTVVPIADAEVVHRVMALDLGAPVMVVLSL